MSKAPAFQLYAGDYFIDTVFWSNREVGVYTRLLLLEWANGPLPSDITKLAKVCHESNTFFERIWSVIRIKFCLQSDGTFINERLEKTRRHQQLYIEKQKEKGQKRAEKMWEGHIATAIATAEPRLQPDVQPEDSPPTPSSSSSNSSLRSELKETPKPPKGAHVSNGIPYHEIIDHLNLRTGKKYRPNSKETRKFIQARWNEGFTIADFIRVIDNQTIKWQHKADMCEFLRPETLFGNKFESYLNATPNLAQAGVVSPSMLSALQWAEDQQEKPNDQD
jgi:uncharacterized phage protein (TIGR02220 family)